MKPVMQCTCGSAIEDHVRSASMHFAGCPIRTANDIERLHQLALGAARDLAHARRKLGEAQAKYQVAADEYNRAVLDSWGWVHAS